MMRIDEEVKLKCEKKEEINFHEEVVLNLILIEVRSQGTSARKSIDIKSINWNWSITCLNILRNPL